MLSNSNMQVMPDGHHPVFHFLPTRNWLNDPNGLIQWNGQYHMFYQYNPNGAFHGTIHWGHAVSRDLVHWEHLPIALTPMPDGFDKDGCWSGCAINNNGVPTLFYTGVHPQVQCMATSSDGNLVTWQKYPQPVIYAPPPEIEAHAGGQIRDPFVWRENDQWYMLLGSKIEGVGGIILLYRSADLLHWEYLHPFLAGDVNQQEPIWTGTMWECPNLLNFGSKHVLIISPQATAFDHLMPVYFLGAWENERFHAEPGQILVHGKYFYAPQVMRADDGRYIMWGWIKEGRSHEQSIAAGWNGVMSLPIQVSLFEDGKLSLEPVKELEALRQEHYHFENLYITPETGLPLDIQGDCFEVQVQFPADLQTQVGLMLRASLDGQDQTRIIYDPGREQLIIHRFNPSPDVDLDNQFAPLTLSSGEPLTLRVFLDHSVLEIFANHHTCLVSRVYPAHETSNHIGLFTQDNPTVITQMDIWKLKDIWK
jgi:beta-fructofuranosidase